MSSFSNNCLFILEPALGVAGENLFVLFQRKKFGTKNPTRQLAGNAQILNFLKLWILAFCIFNETFAFF